MARRNEVAEPGRISEICGIRFSLHVADAQRSLCQLQPERPLASCLAREFVEVFERATNDKLPRCRRPKLD